MGIIDILQGGAKKVTDFLDSPLGKLAIPAAGVLVGAIQQGKQADASRDIAETALDRGDPAGERRGQFQDELSNLYETGEVPFFEPALGHAADAAARRAASQGYNLSNNFVHEVARAVAPLYTQQANRQAEILGALGGFDITPQIQPFVDQAGLAAGLDSSKYEDIFGLMASIPEKAAADRRFKQVMGMLAGMRGMV